MNTMRFLRLIWMVSLVGCIETDHELPFDPTIRITIPKKERIYRIEKKYKLKAEYTDHTGEIVDTVMITWESSNPSIIRIEGDTATGIASGEVMITAIFEDISVSELFMVLESGQMIRIAIPKQERIYLTEEKYKLKAEYTNHAGEIADTVMITWASSNPSIIRIEGDTATGIALGVAMITASFQNLSVSDSFWVEDSRKSIEIAQFVRALFIGETYMFGVNYTEAEGNPQVIMPIWSSSNETIATVNDQGLVTAVSEGMTEISAMFENKSDTILLTVTETPVMIDSEVRITATKEFVQVGEQFQFEAQYYGTDGMPDGSVGISWESSNTSVITIDETGLASAVMGGAAAIIASVPSQNLSDTTKVKVVMDDSEVRITATKEFVQVGEQFQFQAQYYGTDGMPDGSVGISWTSSNTSVITIDETGLASAVMEGAATITASVPSQGLSDITEVKVVGPPMPNTRTGTLKGLGYTIEGSFTLEKNSDGDLILTIENYSPDGPGPYFYLSNRTDNINNGLRLKDATAGGNHTINITEIDSLAELDSYRYLIVWCKPFSVTLGYGEFNN